MNPDLPTPSWCLSPEQAQHLDQVCNTFEAALKAGQRPLIQACLQDIAEPERSALLQELLTLEVAWRQKVGEKPTTQEYEHRFPQHVAQVARVFQQMVTVPQAESGAQRSPSTMPERPATSPEVHPCLTGYDILAEVGRGAMGVVFKAHQIKLDRHVAIKVLLPGCPVDRFRREAQLLAKVRSPNVVTVHDYHVLEDGSPVLVMEWVDGRDLLETMRQRGGKLTEAEALPWMRHTAEGMRIAAEQGIIHRDLKPSNILISGAGFALVGDFGLARGPKGPADLTLTGGMMGTPYYMAPEQAEDPRGVDTRADIYSFGATFYHVLTGLPPFDGDTAFSILFKHKMEPLIPPRAKNREVSPQTSELLERCLAKAPQDRFQSFGELLRHLQPSGGDLSPWAASDDAELAAYLTRYQSRRDVYLTAGMELKGEDLYEFPRGQKLRILRGNLVQQEVDAVVSSDTDRLTMDYGVSKAIREAAGESIVKEAKRFIPVRPGRVVVTSGGSLRARFVFHGVTIGALPDQWMQPNRDLLLWLLHNRWVRPSRDLISEILASCFYEADSLYVQSIAFPLLGTGGAGFSREVCLDTMVQFLARTLLRGLTTVREVRIVLYP